MNKETAQNLSKKLADEFSGDADFEMIDESRGCYRFGLVSAQFKDVPHLTRQDQIWPIVNSELSREDSLDVTLILAFAPDEIDGYE